MVSQQHQRGVEHPHPIGRGGTGGQPRPEPSGDRVATQRPPAPTTPLRRAGAGRRGHRRAQALDQGGHQRAAVRPHRGGLQVDAQRIGARQAGCGHHQALGHRAVVGQRVAGPTGHGQAAGRRGPRGRRLRSGIGELTGPQQLGDLLEAHRAGQGDGVVTPVDQVALLDGGERRRQHDVDGAGPAGAAARPPPPDQVVDLRGVEPAGATVVGHGAPQHPPAHVGVHGRQLDAQTGGHLLGGEEVA